MEGRHETHARLAPSSAHRWMNCPGSIAAIEAIPVGPTQTSAAAEAGTYAHRLLETSLRLGMAISQAQELIPVPDLNPDLIAEMVVAAHDALDHVERNRGDRILELETFVEVIPGLVSGHADIVLTARDFTSFEIIDLKAGSHPVEPDSPQLKLYTTGKWKALPDTIEAAFATIIQPRAEHVDGPVRSVGFDIEEMESFAAEVEAAAAAATAPDAPRKAGSWCKWCPAIATCDEAHALAAKAAADEFPDFVTLEGDRVFSRDLADRLALIPPLKDWIQETTNHALALASDGVVVPGWKIGKRRGSRVWAIPADELITQLTALGLDIDDVAPRAPVSPHRVELMLKALGRKPGEISQLWNRFEGGIALVSETDPAAALMPSAADEFADLEIDF